MSGKCPPKSPRPVFTACFTASPGTMSRFACAVLIIALVVVVTPAAARTSVRVHRQPHKVSAGATHVADPHHTIKMTGGACRMCRPALPAS